MDRDHLSHSPAPTRTALARVGAALCWLIAALACAWIAWCTAIGPLMRADAGLAAFRWTNGVAFVAMFVVCFGIVWLLVRSAHRAADSDTRTTASLGGAADSTAHLSDSAHRTSAPAAHLAGRTIALPPRTARFFAAAGPLARALVMLLFLCCPLVTFSTISLTKSPLFAFAFTWWFGLMYELYMTHRNAPARPQRTRPVTIAALVVSCVIMLVSAKYAWYILMIQVVLSLLADRRRWRLYLLTLLLPTVLAHGAIAMLIGSGAIIGGDPIESRGAQLQMIARVAQRNPGAIPESAARKLAPIFNIDQMAQAYRSEDADPVKSSGIQSKKVSYRWRSVTAEDMQQFNAAWLEIVRADPQTAFDALFAKSYGYFDMFDPPYVPMSYYVDNDYVQQSNTWIKHYNHDWRGGVAHVVRQWSRIPVLGWVTHGNFYVTLTLLIGAAELALRRWRALSWHMPLLLLMGVMITAPANNFERHMLPIAFVFGFLCITFARDNRGGSWVHGPARGTAHDSPRA